MRRALLAMASSALVFFLAAAGGARAWSGAGAYAGLGNATNRTTWARVEAVDAWLRRGGPPPAHWVVRDRSALGSRRWTPLANASAKSVWRARLGRAAVVVKTARGEDGGRYASAKQRAIVAAKHATEIASELLSLELLRGLPGAPSLRGGWLEDGRPSYVVAAAGERLETFPRATYARLARERPAAVAEALLACFWGFAQRGGMFLDDFAVQQFLVAEAGADVVVSLVDAPKALARGPMRDLLAGFPRPHALDSAPRPCAGDADCPASHRSHCCCCDPAPCAKSPCPGGSRGSPESRGVCAKGGNCAPLSSKTHAFDVAARAWALPFIIAEAGRDRRHRATAAFLRDLSQKMTAYNARKRPLLSEALDALARFRRSTKEK